MTASSLRPPPYRPVSQPGDVAAFAPFGAARLTAGSRGDGQAASLDDHMVVYGPCPSYRHRRGHSTLIELVERSGLRGRGGAGFPMARKMRAVAHARGRAVVLANGAEGEPASRKDRFLLSRVPHLVLDGAQLAAEAVGAGHVHIVVPEAHPESWDAVSAALAERDAERCDGVPTTIHEAPDRFVAGESTAVVRLVSGGPAVPAFTRHRTAERGVRGLPTLVSNVETLAQLAVLARLGIDRFRAAGTPEEPGTVLLTVGGSVRGPAVVEVPLGTRLGFVLDALGGVTALLAGVLVGGYHGRWLPAGAASQVPIADRSLRAAGGTLGAGIVIPLTTRDCPIVEAAHVVRYLAGESAGQCGPCVHGLDAIARAMERLATGTASGEELRRIARWCGLVAGRGACHHPDGVAGCPVHLRDVPRRGDPPPQRRLRAAGSRRTGCTAADHRERFMSRPVRLLVDWVACEAHGLCAELVPELITLDDWGYPVVADGDVPARLLPLARRAARACPTLALILESGPAAERARHRGTRSRARGA